METKAPYIVNITPPADLQSALRDLAYYRNYIATIEADQKYLLDQVRKSEHYEGLEATKTGMKQYVDELTALVQELALAAYKADGKKKRPGVTVKSVDDGKVTVEYDYNAAYAWAKERAQELIVLDTALFEAHVLAVAATVPVPCAKIIKPPKVDRAYIDRDLSQFLED